VKLTYGRRAVRGFAAVGLCGRCACGRGVLRVLGAARVRLCGNARGVGVRE